MFDITKDTGKVLFGFFLLVVTVVAINMLIAMMTRSFEAIAVSISGYVTVGYGDKQTDRQTIISTLITKTKMTFERNIIPCCSYFSKVIWYLEYKRVLNLTRK